LDEIEKAHPEVFNILLQVMDNGALTDHNGKKVDFRNVILVMTTNAGAAEASKAAIGFGSSKRTGDDMEAINRLFAPEFRNRLDAIIPFEGLKPISTKGYDDRMGARPLGRVIQEHIKKPLANEVLFGKLQKGGTVKVSVVKKDGESELKLEAIKDKVVKPKKDPTPRKKTTAKKAAPKKAAKAKAKTPPKSPPKRKGGSTVPKVPLKS